MGEHSRDHANKHAVGQSDDIHSIINHLNIQNIGTNSHADIDSHIADATLHFTEASISHLNIDDIGTNAHSVIDSHIADSTIHFVEGSIDHGSIAGLGDDDHAQYALLAGRVGGQSLFGGTASGDDLLLESTSHATKGFIIMNSGSRVGIGTATPATQFHSQNGLEVVTWADGFNRNTSAYFRNDFVTGDLATTLSGFFGVESVWSGGNSSSRNVNSTFYNLNMTGNAVYAGGTQRSMVGQITIDNSGAGFTSACVGMQGKVFLGPNLNTTVFNATGQIALEALIQSHSSSIGTVNLLKAITTRFSISGAGLTITDGHHLYIPNASGNATLTNQYGIWIENLTKGGIVNSAIVLDGDGVGSEIIFGAGQDATIYYDGTDLIINPQLVGTGAVSIPGDLLFTGDSSGLPFGEIYAHNNAVTMSVSNAGYTQVTIFDTNGESNNTTPDHTNDHITIVEAGRYLITVSMAISNQAGVGHVLDIDVAKNNKTTDFDNLHAYRTLASGTDVGSMTLSGIVDVAVNDTIEIWISSDSGVARNITVEDITLSILLIGGT